MLVLWLLFVILPSPSIDLSPKNRFVEEDERSLYALHQLLNQKREIPLTWEEESAQIDEHLARLQDPLKKQGITFPNLPSIRNLPPTPQSLIPTPLPFHLFQRWILDETPYGTPIYLDVRAFATTQLQEIAAIKKWHLSLLSSSSWKEFPSRPTTTLYIGHGDRNPDHFDPSHGLATQDRGILLFFFSDDAHFYVLITDAPWSLFQKHQQDLMALHFAAKK